MLDELEAAMSRISAQIEAWDEDELREDWWNYQRDYLLMANNLPALIAAARERDALREFCESFEFTTTDSFYEDAYLTIRSPDSVHFRLGNGSQFSKHIKALEDRRIAALAATLEESHD